METWQIIAIVIAAIIAVAINPAAAIVGMLAIYGYSMWK